MAGVLDSAVQLYLDDLIEEDIFFMLVKECEETAPVFPYWKYDPFSLEICWKMSACQSFGSPS